MPSKNMIPKGKRRHTVRAEYRAERDRRNAATALEVTAGDAEGEEPALASAPPLAAAAAPQFSASPRSATPACDLALDAPAPTLTEPGPDGVRRLEADPAAAGMRLDAYLAKVLPDISRARVQLLIDAGQVTVQGASAKASLKLTGSEPLEITGDPQPAPLRATPEDIPLTLVYEDDDLLVIDKPAGMAVHAGAGGAESNRGTLVNALLFHFGRQLSSGSGGDPMQGALRPGIVHRLDKDTSGLIVVARNDGAHRRLAEMFAGRHLRKVYLALVHGHVRKDEGTIDLPIGRDPVRRVRMTTRRPGSGAALVLTGPGYPGLGDSGPQDRIRASAQAGEDDEEEDSPDADSVGPARGGRADRFRTAVSHYRVLERISTPYGPFTLLEVRIETGRTHQIRVHLQALGHPVVGDTLYGAPAHLRSQPPAAGRRASAPAKDARGGKRSTAVSGGPAGAPISGEGAETGEPVLKRNFLHAAELEFAHPRTGRRLELQSPLPAELEALLERLRGQG